MKARDIMTEDPVCCVRETSIQEAAGLMLDNDCGEIPVLKDGRLEGVITDRDICCRAVAAGLDPRTTNVGQCMTSKVVSVSPEADAEQCIKIMERNQIRRLPVVDRNGCCCGIISQADIAEELSEEKAGEVLRQVSRTTFNSPRP